MGPTHRASILLAITVTAAGACSDRLPSLDASHLTVCDAMTESFTEEVTVVTSATHTTGPLDFGPEPPTGGPHDPCWASWGVHEKPVHPRHVIHNLEHGGIAIFYNCPDGCDDEITWLSAFTQRNELVIMTEYPKLGTRFGLSAWEARATSDCLDTEFVQSFYERRVDRAPEQFGRPAPEPPSACR